MAKKGQFDIINTITGLIVIGGGIAILLNYVNLGFVTATIGMLIKSTEILTKTGLK